MRGKHPQHRNAPVVILGVGLHTFSKTFLKAFWYDLCDFNIENQMLQVSVHGASYLNYYESLFPFADCMVPYSSNISKGQIYVIAD